MLLSLTSDKDPDLLGGGTSWLVLMCLKENNKFCELEKLQTGFSCCFCNKLPYQVEEVQLEEEHSPSGALYPETLMETAVMRFAEHHKSHENGFKVKRQQRNNWHNCPLKIRLNQFQLFPPSSLISQPKSCLQLQRMPDFLSLLLRLLVFCPLLNFMDIWILLPVLLQWKTLPITRFHEKSNFL